MATVLRTKTSSLFRTQLTTLRNLRTAATRPATTPPGPVPSEGAAIPAKMHRKGNNLFEAAQYLPNWGIGYHMAKKHWADISYQITKINLYRDGRHGKAWGVAHKAGIPIADAPKKISGVHKRCWKCVYSLSKTGPKLSKPEDSTPKPELQNA